MSDPFDIRDRVVIVTGGRGQLGGQFTRALLERGARVVSLDLPLAPRTAEENERLLQVDADVTDRSSLESALEQIEGRWGVPDALVNNAALDSPPDAPAGENGPFETYPGSSFERVMKVNVSGVVQACQVFGGRMAEAGRGSIINISSIYGVVSPNQDIYEYRRKDGDVFFKPVAYSVSKSAILNLSRYLATYWAPRVRVNTLTFAGVFNNQDPRFLEAYCARVPMKRMAEPHEYNGAVMFLISDAASYMTGSNMIIDGGWTSW